MEISDKNLALEIENSVFVVFAKTQMMELGCLFDKVVEEKNEINCEVAVQKVKMESLALLLENEKRNVEKLQLDAQNLFDEKAEKERRVQELEKDRDLSVKNSNESVKVIDELKEKIDMLVKEKDEAEIVNSTQGTKILNLEIELQRVNDLLENLGNEESMMRAKVSEMEGNIGLAVLKEKEMMVENSKLFAEKKEMEKSIESLTEGRDIVQRELENRQREVDEANRARDEIEKVKVSCENEIVELQGEVSRLKDFVDELKLSCREFEVKNNGLLSQVNDYRNAVGEVELERDNIRKGYDEEKNKVENLESLVAELKVKNDIIMKESSGEKNKVENLQLEVAGLKKTIENSEAELIKMRSEKENMNEKNKVLNSGLDVLVTDQTAAGRSLIAIKQERDDLRAKLKQALELLKSTAAHVSKESVEVAPCGEKKHEEEIQYFAEELETIEKAFKVKNEMVDDMKKQVESLQKSVSDDMKKHEEEIQSYSNAAKEVEIERDSIKKGYDEEKNKVENLQSQVVEMEEKIEQLRAQVQSYKNAAEEVEIERDNIRKGYDEEKNKVENLESHVAELKLKNDIIMKESSGEKNKVRNLELEVARLKDKILNAAAEFTGMICEKEKVNEKIKVMGSGLDVLVNDLDATRRSLTAITHERDDFRAKFESSCVNLKQALELLKSTAAPVYKESVELTPPGEKNHEEEIQSFAEELEEIQKALKVKNEMMDDMKKQVVSLQKSESDARKGKKVWTGISSTVILGAAVTTYIAKRR